MRRRAFSRERFMITDCSSSTFSSRLLVDRCGVGVSTPPLSTAARCSTRNCLDDFSASSISSHAAACSSAFLRSARSCSNSVTRAWMLSVGEVPRPGKEEWGGGEAGDAVWDPFFLGGELAFGMSPGADEETDAVLLLPRRRAASELDRSNGMAGRVRVGRAPLVCSRSWNHARCPVEDDNDSLTCEGGEVLSRRGAVLTL
mmetsp:Transcript_36651/g.91883  ORF Transcript_36651/g.91883 Transcript_36651/m.91883 type:complete len:201 (-) Transcript_36651:427-1029(-)